MDSSRENGLWHEMNHWVTMVLYGEMGSGGKIVI